MELSNMMVATPTYVQIGCGFQVDSKFENLRYTMRNEHMECDQRSKGSAIEPIVWDDSLLLLGTLRGLLCVWIYNFECAQICHEVQIVSAFSSTNELTCLSTED